MEHPYRVHSSIGFGFLQLLLLSTLAYPTPPPPLYHNVAVLRVFGTVYFTLFQDYLILECATILIESVGFALYIHYIIRDYTYIFGVFDITRNLIFCAVVGLSLKNGETKWSKISEKLEHIRRVCIGGGPQGVPPPNDGSRDGGLDGRREGGAFVAGDTGMFVAGDTGRRPLYTSLPSSDDSEHANHTPVYTFGARQAFKPSFYSSSWGKEYLNTKIVQEFTRVDCDNSNTVGMISGTDGTTQYIRFDDAMDSTTMGAGCYSNIFVSPYYGRDGTPITAFTGWCKNVDRVTCCVFIYNLLQFIYQLMMYSSIITECREIIANATAIQLWLC